VKVRHYSLIGTRCAWIPYGNHHLLGDGLTFDVEVLDAVEDLDAPEESVGRITCLVRPIAGQGESWVTLAKLRVDGRPVSAVVRDSANPSD
jgi:hypothetical protein